MNEARTPTLEEKVAFLSRPGSWQDGEVVVRETRTSFVFLVGERAYKLKRPIADRLLDFRTLEARRRNAEEEVRLNRRLAPPVYLGTLPLTLRDDGRLQVGVEGRVVDWLVAMQRLPRDLFLDRMIDRRAVGRDAVVALGRRLARFYAAAEPVRPDPGAVLADFAASIAGAAEALQEPAFDLPPERVRNLAGRQAALLADRAPEIRARIAGGILREGHGDLRPEHVFLGDPPAVIDCLEFSRALREGDPFDEVAYLGLECARLGADWIGPLLEGELAAGFGHAPSEQLLGLYRAHRAFLRAHFAMRHLLDPVPREPAKWRPLAEAYLAAAEAALGQESSRSTIEPPS